MNPFLGEIRMFAGNFPPNGWALCNGQLLPIARDTALFSLLGTAFGGNGTTNFQLPNLVDRVPMHWGQGPNLSNRVRGETGGDALVTLTSDQMAAHSHAPAAFPGSGRETTPQGNVWAASAGRDKEYATDAPDTKLASVMAPVGGGQPHANVAPYLAVTYIIALEGVFPQRP
jgi:microcystin-dependent protein